jgi:hypothetical protein
MDTLATFTIEAIELFNKQKELWNKASKWLILSQFDAFNPDIYQAFLNGTSDALHTREFTVKQILLLGNEQWPIFHQLDNDLGNIDLELLSNAYELNEAMILSLIPNAENKKETFSENTSYITSEHFTHEQLEYCLEYLFDK